jgi:hypothetical protein
MNTDELIAKLKAADPTGKATVIPAVGWAADTAYADDGEDVQVELREGRVIIEGWLSNCGTELEVALDDESELD